MNIQGEMLYLLLREAISKKGDYIWVIHGRGGQGPAQISWSTFNFSLLNLVNLKRGGGFGPYQNYMDYFQL